MVKEKHFRENEWKELRKYCHNHNFEPSDRELGFATMLANLCEACPAKQCYYYTNKKQNLKRHMESHHPGEDSQIIGRNTSKAIAIASDFANKIEQARMIDEQKHENYLMSGDTGRLVGSPKLTPAGGDGTAPTVRTDDDHQAGATTTVQATHQYDNQSGMGFLSPSQNLNPYPVTSFAHDGAYLPPASTLTASGDPISFGNQWDATIQP